MKLFNSVKVRPPKKSKFDLSHEKKLTMNMGELIPVLLEEVMPGDKFRVNTELLCRFHPMLAPIMHRIDAFIHYFYVPNRLVYQDWDKFITGGDKGTDTPAFPTISILSLSALKHGTLADYMGLPTLDSDVTNTTTMPTVSALPFRAYQLIFNEYYRDENLQDELPIKNTGTVDDTEKAILLTLRRRAWTKDYFTSALPYAQKGDSVMIPAEIGIKPVAQAWNTFPEGEDPSSTPPTGTVSVNASGYLTSQNVPFAVEAAEGLEATINDLRTAVRLQEWLEKNARAGSRLFESILVHFGVYSDDLRIGRPQYLGGGRTAITVSEVLSTNETDTLDLGKMGGHGIGVGNQAYFKGYFKEHGHIIGIMSILPKPAYQQGLPKMFTRFDKLEYPWPEFANLGEQAVLNKELYFDFANPQNNDGTFGYQSRYAELKFGRNSVHGDFKENLSFWHCGRIFANLPTLSTQFVECNPSDMEDRIFPVQDSGATDKIYVQLYNNVTAVRPLPYFGTPRF